MLWVFLLSLTGVVLPVVASVLSSERTKERSFILIPLGILTQFGFLTFFAMVSAKLFSAGLLHLIFSTLLAGAATHFSLAKISIAVSSYRLPIAHWKALAWLGAAGLSASLDSSYILGAQGWNFQDWSIFPLVTSYFSNPFHSDGQRHVILVNAILRREGSPFLEGASLTYPLFWFHFAAALVSPLKALENFGPVSGVVLFTNLVLSFSVIWAATLVRPSLWNSPKLVPVLLLIAFCQADLYHFAYSLIAFNRPAIESDGSFLPIFIRNSSLKLTGLTAPGHAFFLCFAAIFLVLPLTFKRSRRNLRSVCECVALTFSTLCSPVLALLFYPPLFVLRAARAGKNRHRTELKIGLASTAIALICFWILNGSAGLRAALLPVRESTQLPALSSGFLAGWLLLPFVWLGTMGILGGLLTFLGARLVFLKRFKVFGYESVLLLGALSVLYHYGVSGTELRRHFAMLAGMLGILALARVLPRAAVFRRQPSLTIAVHAIGVIGLCLHLYFVHSHTRRSNLLDPSVEWRDYHEINRSIRESFPATPTLAASGRGQMYPSVMEATASFSLPRSALEMSNVKPHAGAVLPRIQSVQDIPSYSLQLGYRAVVWGPIEDRLWGERVKRRFVESTKLIAHAGTVSLFGLTDHLRAELERKLKPGTAAFHFEFGQSLARGGWTQEALDHFSETIRLSPSAAKAARAHNAIGILHFESTPPRLTEARMSFETALRLDPKQQDAPKHLAALLLKQDHVDSAIAVLQTAVRNSNDPELYGLLGQAFAFKSDNEKAAEQFEKALNFNPMSAVRTRALLGLADIHVREGRFAKAVTEFRQVIQLDPNHEAVRVKLGNCLAYQGKTKEAVEQYNQALRINPRFEPARLAIAALARAGSGEKFRPSF